MQKSSLSLCTAWNGNWVRSTRCSLAWAACQKLGSPLVSKPSSPNLFFPSYCFFLACTPVITGDEAHPPPHAHHQRRTSMAARATSTCFSSPCSPRRLPFHRRISGTPLSPTLVMAKLAPALLLFPDVVAASAPTTSSTGLLLIPNRQTEGAPRHLAEEDFELGSASPELHRR
uniref:Uncharacterized protein n=1 Tax=Setaria viridis TaxID=4556 RepID=A0A4U6UML1_SETVI|nr:hypothetical protein SEVIR_5G279532v2 [Setaria viridis]